MPAQKFPGPCVLCHSVDPSGYYKKQMCNACYKRTHRVRKPKKSLVQYAGPCVVCGTNTSSDGRFIRKMCHSCYKRVFLRQGNPIARSRYVGPCARCGESDTSLEYNRQMCPRCYKWYRNNVRLDNTNRKARQSGISCELSEQDWQRVLEHHDYHCAYCGKNIRDAYTMDHVIPLSKGGAHAIHNVVPSCLSCNSGKRDKLFIGPLRILYA